MHLHQVVGYLRARVYGAVVVEILPDDLANSFEQLENVVTSESVAETVEPLNLPVLESTPSSRSVAGLRVQVRRVHELWSRKSSCDDEIDKSFAYSRIETLRQHFHLENRVTYHGLERPLDPRVDLLNCERAILAKDVEGHYRHVCGH